MDKFIQMGRDLGYEGQNLQDFVKQQQDYEKAERLENGKPKRIRSLSKKKIGN